MKHGMVMWFYFLITALLISWLVFDCIGAENMNPISFTIVSLPVILAFVLLPLALNK